MLLTRLLTGTPSIRLPEPSTSRDDYKALLVTVTCQICETKVPDIGLKKKKNFKCLPEYSLQPLGSLEKAARGPEVALDSDYFDTTIYGYHVTDKTWEPKIFFCSQTYQKQCRNEKKHLVKKVELLSRNSKKIETETENCCMNILTVHSRC